MRKNPAEDTLVRAKAHTGHSGTKERNQNNSHDGYADRQTMEENLRASEEKFRGFFNNTPDYCFIISPEGTILNINESALQALGYEREELVGKPLAIIYAPESITKMKDLFYEWKEKGQVINEEMNIITKRGESRTVLLNAGAVRDKDGRILYSTSVQNDITSRKRAEEELKNSISLLRATLESTADGILVVDNSGKIADFNDQFVRLWNIPHEVIAKKDDETAVKFVLEQLKDPEQFISRINELYARPDAESFDVIEFKDGRIFERYSQPQKLDSKPVGRVWSFRDVTSSRKAEVEIRRAYEEIKSLKEKLELENVYLREEISRGSEFESIVGQSDAMKYVFFRIQQVAPTDSTVLITGETGTGKGLVARAVHEASRRRNRSMVVVNCAALPETLIESELFGSERGAFTGADKSRAGRFELADKGTIFLDEVGELPLELQAKLLRVIESGEFERLGSPRTTRVDVRIIASTNRELKKEIQEGRFREDLFYRLNVFPITMPPLRQRADDIPVLVSHFVAKHGKKIGKSITEIPQKVMKALEEFSWPGNVRELENVIERAVISTRGHVLQLAEPFAEARTSLVQIFKEGLADVERDHIIRILNQTIWKIEGKNGAAWILGLRPSTLRSRMKKLGIRRSTDM